VVAAVRRSDGRNAELVAALIERLVAHAAAAGRVTAAGPGAGGRTASAV
jgi:hypothetical protein